MLISHITNPFQPFLFSWHMPLFFIISGFFLDKEADIKSATIKDCKRLVIPFFVASIIGLFVEVMKRAILSRDEISISEKAFEIFYSMDYSALEGTYGFVLWFLPCLFLAKLITRALCFFVVSVRIQILLVILMFLIGREFELVFALDNALFCAVFVWLGRVLYPALDAFDDSNGKTLFLSILVGALLLTHLIFKLPSIDLARKILIPEIYALGWSVGCAIVIILVSIIFERRLELLSRFNRLSFFSFIAHPYSHNVADQVCGYIGANSWIIIYFMSLAVLVVLFCLYTCLGERIGNLFTKKI